MAMRAGGLLAGGGLLVVSWVAWFASSGPINGPHTSHAAFASPSVRGKSVFAERPPEAPGVPSIPVFAELRDGTPLAGFLASRGTRGTLSIAVFDQPPTLVPLLSGSVYGAIAWPRTEDLASGLGGEDPAYLAQMALPREGAWIALYVDGILLDARRIGPDRTLVRFELDAASLHEALGLPLT